MCGWSRQRCWEQSRRGAGAPQRVRTRGRGREGAKVPVRAGSGVPGASRFVPRHGGTAMVLPPLFLPLQFNLCPTPALPDALVAPAASTTRPSGESVPRVTTAEAQPSREDRTRDVFEEGIWRRSLFSFSRCHAEASVPTERPSCRGGDAASVPACGSASRRPGEHPEASLRARRCHALAWCDIEASRPPTDIRNLYVWHQGQFLATRPPRLYDRHGFDLAPRAGFLSGFPAEKAASGRCPSTVRASVASWLRMFVGTPELGHHAASGRTPHSAQRTPFSTSVQWR